MTHVHRMVSTRYRGSWRRMFLELPHIRFDGIYVARNTYIRTGVVEWRNRYAAHLVSYFRYFRYEWVLAVLHHICTGSSHTKVQYTAAEGGCHAVVMLSWIQPTVPTVNGKASPSHKLTCVYYHTHMPSPHKP